MVNPRIPPPTVRPDAFLRPAGGLFLVLVPSIRNAGWACLTSGITREPANRISEAPAFTITAVGFPCHSTGAYVLDD